METPNPNRGVDAFGASTHSTLATQEGLVPTRETAAPRGPRGEDEEGNPSPSSLAVVSLLPHGRRVSHFFVLNFKTRTGKHYDYDDHTI